MSLSPDPAVSNLSHNLYLQRNSRPNKTLDQAQSRGRNTSRHELGRRDGYGERVTRIYPRELANSPSNGKRFSSTSASPPAYNATTSPLLSALGATTTAAQYTKEWTKSLPFPANQASPTNGGVAINGSPPTFHNSPGPRDLYTPAAMSNSPPAPGMRPLSHPNNYTSFGGRLQSPAFGEPGRDRRASMYSQLTGRSPFSVNPPLPHQPQEHYYNLPGLDLGVGNGANEGITAGEGGYYCGFDTLSMAGDEPSKPAGNVLLTGYQGGIDVFRVERSRMDILGRLEGLRGRVLSAKLLPWTARRDPCSSIRPLIALVIHGPAMDDPKPANSSSENSSVVDDSQSDSPSRPASSIGKTSTSRVTSYQTTVEVYSLKEKRQVAVLYKSPLIPVTSPIDSPMFEPPAPAGQFVIDANGKFVVVASGASGEVFIFAPYLTHDKDHPEQFRCIGKVWTSVSFRERAVQSTSTSAADGSHDEVAPETYGVPIFSLSNRWLAVAPPDSTTLFPVNGVALTSRQYAKPPGLAHHTVPPQPTPNCAVDIPEAGGLLDRLAREGTQVAIKSARWATERGLQAFKNYMNKPQTNGSTNGASYGLDAMPPGYFPPTHGQNHTQPRQETTVISIYDLQRLLEAEDTKSRNALHPLTTIPAALGCSFLSFSPTGLMLMTVSAKGDLQDVWDLKRMNFRRTRKTAREQLSGPHVRQVARFARMTVTNIVDVVWPVPQGDRVAIITDNGTVHMFLMPASAFQWPPPRRNRQPATPSKPKEEVNSTTGRGGAINSAFQALNGTAKPFLNAVRNTSNGSRFPSLSSLGITPAAGAKSGKAVAANVGKSISNIRHAGDNKLTMPSSPSGVKPCRVRWLTGKNRGAIALVNGGVLQIYRVNMRPSTGKGKPTRISKKKLAEFGLATVRDTRFAPAVAEELVRQPGEPETVTEVHGDWLPRSLPARRGKPGGIAGKSPVPLSFSEIETNPPYQPFSTDRRSTRFVFAETLKDSASTSNLGLAELEQPVVEEESNILHLDDEVPWLFGESFGVVRILSPVVQHYDSGDEVAAHIENKLTLKDGEEEVEQIIVTTRRQRLRPDDTGDDGFFEDDCDVLDFAEDRV